MKCISKILTTLAAGLLLTMTMQASPAAAASKVFYIDDTPNNNGSVKCPNPVGDEIEDAIDAFNGANDNLTINVCPGKYTLSGELFLGAYTNLKIIGLGNPVITATGSSGFFVDHSTNVTIQGLIIDGQGNLAAHGTAITYNVSSGVLKENTILGWHMTYPSLPTVPVPLTTPIYAIAIFGSQGGKTVSVLNNTIYDSQDIGLFVFRTEGGMKISGNRVVFSSAITPAFYSPDDVLIQAGIAVMDSSPGVVISGNEVISDADLYPQNAGFTRGILLYETSGAKVTGNTVRGTYAQISIENWCNHIESADGNLISGNKLYDTQALGIYITARTDGSTDCGVPHANGNKISGNTIYSLDLNPMDNPYGNLYGVYLETVRGAAAGPIDGLIANTLISGNTIAGFGIDPASPQAFAIGGTENVTGTASSKNKLLAVPPTGIYK